MENEFNSLGYVIQDKNGRFLNRDYNWTQHWDDVWFTGYPGNCERAAQKAAQELGEEVYIREFRYRTHDTIKPKVLTPEEEAWVRENKEEIQKLLGNY